MVGSARKRKPANKPSDATLAAQERTPVTETTNPLMVGSARKRKPANKPSDATLAAQERTPVTETTNPLMVGSARKRKPGRSTPLSGASPPRSVTPALGAQPPTHGASRGREIAEALTRWYDRNRRHLPWRESPSPYATWVSEIMLQQTQVAAVVPYFERWMARFSSISELASADVDEVLSAWQGLGYYSRARNLHRAAQLLVEKCNGELPASASELRALPGIGAYTAGAIASIAFDRPEPAVDGNVERVIARLEALRGDPKSGDAAKRIREFAAEWVKLASPRRFNQALMELGALVCTPERPNCVACPVLAWCAGHRQGIEAELPETRPRPKPETRNVAIIFSQHRSEILLVRQPESARHWSTLFTLPFVEHTEAESAVSTARRLLAWLDPKAELVNPRPVAELVYPITRFRFEARVYEATRVRAFGLGRENGSYVSTEKLAGLALPAPHRRLITRLMARSG